jgi:hypothetical protein
MSDCAREGHTKGWTAGRRCHCSGCHQNFGGLSSFDKHVVKGVHLNGAALGLTMHRLGYWTEKDD